MNDSGDNTDSNTTCCFPWQRSMSSNQPKKKPKIERLVGFSLLLILRYAIPRAQAQEVCNFDELPEQDDFHPPPRLKCQQGFFSRDLGLCVCDFAWTGTLCEVCLTEPCIRKARITKIQPQRAPLDSTPLIQFIGHGFPRTVENSYSCLFNETKVAGKWINSTTIDCMRPKNLTANAPYQVALVPTGLYRVIRFYEEAFFDFYESCTAPTCSGVCLQSLCVCKQGKAGENCTEDIQLLSNQCFENQTQVYNATEFQSFSALVVSNDAQKASLISASIPQLAVSQLNGLLTWNQPIGSSQAQWVDYQVKREDCTDYVHAIINVPTVYQPQVTSVTKHKTSNLHRVSGYIKFNGTTTDIAQNNLPVVLKVFEGNQLVEQIKIESKRRFFTHDTYPYTGNQKDYLIFAEHPSPQTNTTPGLAFTNCVISAEYETTIVNDDTTLPIFYVVQSEGCLCAEWSVKVLWPRELIRVHSQAITGQSANPTIKITISLDPTVNVYHEEMYVAISCDSSASFTAKHNLIYKTQNQIKVYPEKIEIYADPLEETSVFAKVSVETSGQSLHIDTHTSGLSPFFLVMPPTLHQVSNDTTRITYLFGVNKLQADPMEGILKYPTAQNPLFTIPYTVVWSDWKPNYQFFLNIACSNMVQQGDYAEVTILSSTRSFVFAKAVSLNAVTKILPPDFGVYELSITSENFFSHIELITINSVNTTRNIVLEQRPPKYLSLNGNNVEFVGSGVMPMRPELLIEPSVIVGLGDSVWLNFIYKQGPKNSMAIIRVSHTNIGSYQLTNLPSNISIAVGSGYRHPVKVSLSTDQSSKWAKTVYVLKIPYVYTIPGTSKDFSDTASIALDFRPQRIGPIHFEPKTEILTRSTKVYDDCVAQLLDKCRPKFRRLDLCSNAWTGRLNSHLPSMQSFMQALLYKQDCTNSGLLQTEAIDMLRCVISANIGSCQIENQLTSEMLKCTQKSPSLYLKTNLFNTAAQQLNVSRFDLCRLVNKFYKQLFYLNALVPSTFQNGALDGFLDTISSASDLGEFITLTETLTFQVNTNELLVVSNWNRLYEELNYQNVSQKEPFEPTSSSVLETLSVFLNTVAKLNFLSRQIANTDPPALLNGLLKHMLNDTGKTSTVVMNANLHIEPKCLRESRNFDVRLHLNNPTTNITIEKLELRIRFKGQNSEQVNYRIKSTLYNGRKSSPGYLILGPGQSLTVQWSIIPTFDFRLTQKLNQTAVVGISFEVDEKERWQEVRSNLFQIEPAETLRTITLLYPNVTTKDGVHSNPFNAQISVLNIGYSQIRQVRLVNILPDISSMKMNEPLEFRLDSIHVDGYEHSNMLDVTLGDMKSGETRQILINFSAQNQDGFLRNLSFTCASDSSLLDSYSGRQFYVRKQIQKNSFLVSEMYDMYQLYHFQSNVSNLIPLNTVFFAQEEPVQQSDNCFTSIVQAFRLADERKRFDSPLVGSSQWPKSVDNLDRLVAIFQVFPNFDVMQRVVAWENIWISDNGQKEVNFIDLSPFTSASEIFYELVFASSECTTRFSFLQRHYHIQHPSEALFKYSIVAQIQAIVPENAVPVSGHLVEYKLLSLEPNLPYAVLAENGAIIFMNATSINDQPHCAVLVAEDGEGRLTNATIQLGGRQQTNCTQPNSTAALYQHVLGGAHNLPFDYNIAIAEFLKNARESNLLALEETTTEQPGDEWTTQEGEILFATPQSTLQSIATTTNEPIHEPDATLTSVQLSTTPLPSISPDMQVSEHTGATTKSNVQVANVLPTLEPTTTENPNDTVLIDSLTMTMPPTTSTLPIVTSTEVRKNATYNSRNQSELEDRTTSAELIDTACKNRNQKPIFQVLCDLAKSVYRTHA